MISDSTREQIRAANDVVEVIGAVVPLKRAGTNFVGLCPFHREKTPSFNVSPSRQLYRCFGCGKSGDVFRFIMDYENLTFIEALRRLAERAHIEIKEDETPGSGEARAIKDKLFTIHEQITQRWQSALTTDPGSQIARDYLAKRQVPDEAVKLFRIGYAPDAWDDTVNWAKSKNFDLELVAQAGLIIKKDTGGYYDRFRGRLMFPICDEQGRVVAFSGRVLSGDEKTAKYVNSPETPLFTKGRIIFGLDKAKRAILDRQFAVVCEGQLDMIACFMAGVQNTVAPQGTAFTGEQARLLKRYTKEVVLCFDSDNAGQKAAVRALDDLINSGLAMRVAPIPAPHDPDSFIKKLGPEAFNDLIKNAIGYFDFYLDLLCKQNDIATDRGQKEVARAMATALQKTGDQILFDRYARHTALRLGVDPVQAVQGFKRLAAAAAGATQSRRADENESAIGEAPIETEQVPPAEQELLFLAFSTEDQLEWISRHLDFHWLKSKSVGKILEMRLTQHDDGRWPTAPAIIGELESDASAQSLLAKIATDPRKLLDFEKQIRLTLLSIRDGYISREIQSAMQQTAIAPPEEQAALFARQAGLRALRSSPLMPVSDASEI